MYYLVVIFSVVLASLSQMMLKKSARIKRNSFLKDYLNVWVIMGYIILGISLVLNIFAMQHGILVKEVGTIEALSYVFVPTLSYLFFNEKLNLKKTLSILIILAGIVVFFQ